jgi:hypothetical protein
MQQKFKTFLQNKIPEAALKDNFPEARRWEDMRR